MAFGDGDLLELRIDALTGTAASVTMDRVAWCGQRRPERKMVRAGGMIAMMAGAAALLLGACVIERSPAPRQPQPSTLQPVRAGDPPPPSGPQGGGAPHSFAGGAAETSPAVAMAPGVARGRPLGMHPGAPPAVWIWVNPRGVWRLRTTTGGRQLSFTGKVAGITGPITEVVASRVELSAGLGRTTEGVSFSLATGGNVDGFDFRVGDGGCVRIAVDPGGQNEPRPIFVGAAQLLTPGPHFILCP